MSGADEREDEIGRAAKTAIVFGGVLALAALSLYGTRTALSVLVGATIGVANLFTMRAIVRALVNNASAPDADADADAERKRPAEASTQEPENAERPVSSGGGAGWAVFAALKMLILFGGVWILLTQRLVDPMPLVIGYGVMPLAIAASAVWSSVSHR